MSSVLQALKVASCVPPGAIVDNASWTATAVDARGARECLILVHLGALDIAMSALKLQECDTVGGVYTDITGTVGGTAFTLPIATDDNKFVGIYVNMRGRKPFLKPVLTGGDGSAGTYLTCIGILSGLSTAPSDATARGLVAQAVV